MGTSSRLELDGQSGSSLPDVKIFDKDTLMDDTRDAIKAIGEFPCERRGWRTAFRCDPVASPRIALKRRPGAARFLALLGLSGALAGCEILGPCTSSACTEDRQITSQVREQFAKQPELQAPNQVSVQTRHHVVYLTGLVNTPFEQQMAQSIAEQVPGVTSVDNGIALSGNGH